MSVFIGIFCFLVGAVFGVFMVLMIIRAEESKKKREIEAKRRDITTFKTFPERKKSS